MFTRKPDPLPPEYEGVLSCHPKNRDYLTKSVHKNIGALRQTLQSQEVLAMITLGDDIGEIGVITTGRVFTLRKNQIRKQPLAIDDLTEIRLGKVPRNGGTYMIWLQTESFRLDFREEDPERWTQSISMIGDVERDVQNIAAIVRELQGQG